MEEVEATAPSPPPPRRVLLISAGASHSVALLSGNVVCSWGRGEDGQLGHGSTDDRLLPTQLSALDSQQIVSVVCGADHTIAYSESRVEVYSWGWGDFGRLGHGNSSDLFIPQPIRALQGLRIKQIACGDSHCLAVTMEGEVQSWGRNQNGQLGLGTVEDSLVPQKIQTFQ
ncbi:putative E3 ubiquitin-protein ligase HERC1-like protein, partial [Trifolium pratense]